MAVLSGRAAAQWQEFENMADTYPLLQYQTIGDANVRPEHAQLDGVIRPINDPFWTIFYPPNDWGCRCDVIQVTDENAVPTKKEDIKAPEMKKIFKNNVGITGKVFPDSHPYFEVLPEHIVMGAAILWGLSLPQNEGKKSVDLQDNKNKVKVNIVHSINDFKTAYKSESGGEILEIKPNSQNASENKENLLISKIYADLGEKVFLVPKEGTVKEFEYIKNKLFDANISGKSFEFKTNSVSTYSSIDSEIRAAKNQANNITLRINSNISKEVLATAIMDRLSRTSNLEIIDVIWKNNLVRFSTKRLTKEKIINDLK